MRKSNQFEYGVLEVKTQCFRGFQPRVHELSEGGGKPCLTESLPSAVNSEAVEGQ